MLLLFFLFPAVLAGRMETLYSWTFVDFNFPSDSLRDIYLANGDFIPKNNLVIDVDVWSAFHGGGRKVFVTLPKTKPGIPVTLATVTNLRRNDTTLLQPYPDWSWHQGDCDGITSVFRTRVSSISQNNTTLLQPYPDWWWHQGDCDGITSVFRTRVDKCGRLWVLDSGTVEVFTGAKRICPAQILVFDLHTDTLVKRYRIPESNLDQDSLLINIAVDTRTEDCSDAFAYVADVVSFKLIVYDFERDKSWRVSSNLFYPYPLDGEFNIAGKHFYLMDGLFALALGSLRANGDRILYFHSLASVRESWVSTAVVRNGSMFSEDPEAAQRSFHVFESTRGSQSAAQDMTEKGVLLFSLVEENAIGCWNTHVPFRKQNLDVIAKDDIALQFQSGLKVYGNLVWTLSSRFQNYYVDEVPDDEINYRINVGRISDLVHHTKCDLRSSGGSSSSLHLSFKSP